MQFGSTCLNFSHKMRMSPTWKEKEIGPKHLNHSWQQCWSYEEEWEGSITWETENEAELDSFSSRGSRVIELQFDCSETIKHWLNLLFEAQALPCQHNLHRNEGLWCPDISVKRKLASYIVECFCNLFRMCPFCCDSYLNTAISLTSN